VRVDEYPEQFSAVVKEIDEISPGRQDDDSGLQLFSLQQQGS